MKVVLFCGGQGLRLREYTEHIPKPMVEIGYRPMLWHIMKYYAHHGHKDFILCLGYKANVVKDYFLHYDEAVSNDFVLAEGGKSVQVLHSDISDWTITCVDTGMHSNIGQRLRRVRQFVEKDEMFLANYGDNLTDAPLNDVIANAQRRDKIASFLCVRPGQTFHIVRFDGGDDHAVKGIQAVSQSDVWINGGYFCFRPEIFEYMEEGDELVEKPFERLIRKGELIAYRHRGFWAPMDTLRDMQRLNELWDSGKPPWALWNQNGNGNGGTSAAR